MSGERAARAMVSHHALMVREVDARVEEIVDHAIAGRPIEPAVEALHAYLTTEILPHAAAEEEELYPVAAGRGLAPLIDGMVAEHRDLTTLIGRLGAGRQPREAVLLAGAVSGLFRAHVRKENELILPVLTLDPEVEVGSILERMHGVLERVQAKMPAGESAVRD